MKEETAKRLMKELRDGYDAIAEDFSAGRTELWPELLRFREFVKPGHRVLDIGCGNGRAYTIFDGLAIDYVGLDASSALIDIARAARGGMLATFEVGDALALPHDDGEFDAVISVAAFHHIPSAAFRAQAFREAVRVLAPGGVFMMTNWARVRPKYLLRHARAALRKTFLGSDLDYGDVLVPWNSGTVRVSRYYHWLTKRAIARACRDSGLDVLYNSHVRKGEPVPWFLADNILTICRKPAPAADADEAGVTGM